LEVGSAVLVIVATGARRVELRKGLAAIAWYLGFAFVTRGKDYRVLEHPLVQAAHASAERLSSSNGLQSQMVRSRDLCPEVPVGPEGLRYRVVVATR
jgi:hypothetical protein